MITEAGVIGEPMENTRLPTALQGLLAVQFIVIWLFTEATPVPLKEALCGDPEALSVTLTVPVREPVTEGVKVIMIVQFPPGAILAPLIQVLAADRVKSLGLVPVITGLLSRTRVDPPVLVRVRVCGMLV